MTPQPANAQLESPAGSPNGAANLQGDPAAPLPVLAKADSPNGSPGRHSTRAAKPRRWSKGTKLFVMAATAVLILGGTAAAYVLIEKPFQKTRTDLVTRKVHRGTLELKIVERGQLESSNNSDIVCQVKAKTQGGTVATTIRWLVDDGTRVTYDRPKEQVKSAFIWDTKAGAFKVEQVSDSGQVRCVKVKDSKTGEWVYADLLMELDDSSLQDQLVTQSIALDGAKDDQLQAEKALEITLSQNTTVIQKAEADVQVAEINLKKYLEGDYIAKLKDYEGQIKSAQSDVEQQIDRVAWANRMLKKSFQTASQAQSEQLKLESLELTLGKAQMQMRVLTGYEKAAQEITLRAAVATAKATLSNEKSKALSQETKDRSALTTKKSVYTQQQSRYKDILEQLEKCKVWAPRSGIAVYYIPEQARWGVGSRQSIVAQGESVGEGQKMMQIPDLEHMLVLTKVHEALAPRVHKGQEANVRVDSFYEQPLKGTVEFIATVASSADFLSGDVRVYTTKIAIKDPIEGLRPGSNAEVTITIGDAITNALLVPIEAVVGGTEMGDTRKVFVLTADGPQERSVTIGKSNAEFVEIKKGLEENEEVVLNPKTLVGDSVKTRKPGEGGAGPEKPAGPGKGGKAGPGGGRPGGPGAGGPRPGAGPGGQPDPQQMQQMQKALVDRFRAAPKEKRKDMLNQVPEAYRDKARQTLQAAGVEIP